MTPLDRLSQLIFRRRLIIGAPLACSLAPVLDLPTASDPATSLDPATACSIGAGLGGCAPPTPSRPLDPVPGKILPNCSSHCFPGTTPSPTSLPQSPRPSNLQSQSDIRNSKPAVNPQSLAPCLPVYHYFSPFPIRSSSFFLRNDSFPDHASANILLICSSSFF